MLKINKSKMVSYDLIIYKKLNIIRWFSYILIALELLIPTTQGKYLDTSCLFAYIMCIIIFLNYRTNTQSPVPKFMIHYWVILRVIWVGIYLYGGWIDIYTTILVILIEIAYFTVVLLVRETLEVIDKETDEDDFRYVDYKQIRRLKINPSEFHGDRIHYELSRGDNIEINEDNNEDDW